MVVHPDAATDQAGAEFDEYVDPGCQPEWWDDEPNEKNELVPSDPRIKGAVSIFKAWGRMVAFFEENLAGKLQDRRGRGWARAAAWGIFSAWRRSGIKTPCQCPRASTTSGTRSPASKATRRTRLTWTAKSHRRGQRTTCVPAGRAHGTQAPCMHVPRLGHQRRQRLPCACMLVPALRTSDPALCCCACRAPGQARHGLRPHPHALPAPFRPARAGTRARLPVRQAGAGAHLHAQVDDALLGQACRDRHFASGLPNARSAAR